MRTLEAAGSELTEGETVTTRQRRSLGRPGEAPVEFAQRHIGPAEAAQARMLKVVGCPALDALTEAALPAGITDRSLSLPDALTEEEALAGCGGWPA